MAASAQPPDQVRRFIDILANQEKGRSYALACQSGQDPWSRPVRWTVIEGKDDLLVGQWNRVRIASDLPGFVPAYVDDPRHPKLAHARFRMSRSREADHKGDEIADEISQRPLDGREKHPAFLLT